MYKQPDRQGWELQRIRYRAGLSRRALAELTGVKEITISHYEMCNHERRNVETLTRLLDALGYELRIEAAKGRQP